MQLDGKFNPLADQKGEYPKKVSQILEGFRRTDPPVQPQLAIPVSVVNQIRIARAQGRSSE